MGPGCAGVVPLSDPRLNDLLHGQSSRASGPVLIGFPPEPQPFITAAGDRSLGRLPDQGLEAELRPVGCQFPGIAAVGRSALALVTVEQPQQPSLRPQQASHGVAVFSALAGVDGTETGVLQHAAEAAAHQAGAVQGLGIEQIGLQPPQSRLLAMQAPRLADGFGAEIQPHHVKPVAGQKGGFVAATAPSSL